MPLQDICRIVIRRILRRNIQLENPHIDRKRPRKQRVPGGERQQHRINLVPMQSGLMVMRQFVDSDSETEESIQMEDMRNMEESEEMLDDEARDRVFSSLFLQPRRERGREEPARNLDGGATSPPEEMLVDNGFVDGSGEVEYAVYRGEMDTSQDGPEGMTEAISIRNRKRNSSSNGFSASYSSGVGTCGSLEAESVGLVSQCSGVFQDEGDSADFWRSHSTDASEAVDTANGNSDTDDRPGRDAMTNDEHGVAPSSGDDEKLNFIPISSLEALLPLWATSGAGTSPPHAPKPPEDKTVEGQEDEANEDKEDQEPGATYRTLLQLKVAALPVPLALKSFLLFYRN